MDIREATGWAVKRLVSSSGTPQLDAQLLLAHALGTDRSYLFAHSERPLSDDEQARYSDLVHQRLDGQPIAQITGVREFWSLPLRINDQVLVPRPETELLVNLSLANLQRTHRVDIADLGTGSGAIALALAIERPNARVVATDNSEAALDVARENAARLGILKIDFRLGDWCAALPQRQFDLIVSNPPYIAPGDVHLEGDIQHEPVSALVAGDQGMEDLARIAREAKEMLEKGGVLVLEHGHDQRDALVAILLREGYQGVETFEDESGVPRAAVAVWNKA